MAPVARFRLNWRCNTVLMPQKTWNPKGLSTMQCHAKVKCTPLQVIMARTFESFSHREPKMFLLTDKLRVSKFEFKEICYPFNVSHHKYFETEFLTYTLIDNQLSKKICLKRSSEMNEWMKKKQNKQTKKKTNKTMHSTNFFACVYWCTC